MKRSSAMLRRAAMALNSLVADCGPQPSRSSSFFDRARVAHSQREDVLRRLDEAVVVEGLDVLLAEPFDVESVARDEVLQALDALRRTDEAAGAAAHDVDLAGLLVHLAHGVAAAGGAELGNT